MPLDPIVSLTVAVAESPGSCALFLGSGVSVDAGVPTGWEIYLDGVRKLYRLEQETAETPDDDALLEWLRESGRGDFNYSTLLDEIVPDPATRREYLAGHFAGIEPGPTHQRIADLVEGGLVKVIVTTNFDRLLERAVEARGIEPVVVSDDATLAAAPRREHSECFLLKAHGDYLQETIRNTPGELEALEPGVTAELQTIFDHYGLVVMGYAGGDEAIAQAFQARTSRYGLWWMSIHEPIEPARTLIEVTGGRSTVRAGAAEFLGDLIGRLAVYTVHPTGHTPASVHDEILGLIRHQDAVGLDVALRREQNAYEERLLAWTADNVNQQGADPLREALPNLMAAIERRLASIIPLAVHQPEELEAAVTHLAGAIERQPVRGGYTHWLHPAQYGAWFIGYATGALLVRLGRWRALGALLTTTYQDDGYTERLLYDVGPTGRGIGDLHQADGNTRFIAPYWEHLHTALSGFDWLVERYPELFSGEDQPRANLSAFDLIAFAVAGARGDRVLGYWSMSRGGTVEDVARHAHHASGVLEMLAGWSGTDVEEFKGAISERRENMLTHGDFVSWAPLQILATGARDPN